MIAHVHGEQYSPKKQRTVVVCVSAGECLPIRWQAAPPLWSLLNVLPGQRDMSKAIFQITAQNNHSDVVSDSNHIFWFAQMHSEKKKKKQKKKKKTLTRTLAHSVSCPNIW